MVARARAAPAVARASKQPNRIGAKIMGRNDGNTPKKDSKPPVKQKPKSAGNGNNGGRKGKGH